MQPFSLFLESLGGRPVLAAASVQSAAEIWEQAIAMHGVATLLFYFATSFLAGIASIWVASLAMAPKGQATIGRAFLVWLGWLVASVVVVICAGLGFSLALAAANKTAFFLGLGLLGILLLAVLFGVPMAVYEIGLLRSLGFFVITFVTNFAAQFGLELAFLGTSMMDRPAAVRRLVASARPQNSRAVSRDDLLERQDRLRRRHEALEIRRQHLPPNDAQALTDYKRDVQTYERDLAQLKDDTARRLSSP